eukprot:6254696-Amphidinium_carterae.1
MRASIPASDSSYQNDSHRCHPHDRIAIAFFLPHLTSLHNLPASCPCLLLVEKHIELRRPHAMSQTAATREREVVLTSQ